MGQRLPQDLITKVVGFIMSTRRLRRSKNYSLSFIGNKTAYKEKYSQWMATGPKTYTAAGNVRAPSKALCLQWVKECWEALPAKIIRKSFRVCGISVNTDGTEDGLF